MRTLAIVPVKAFDMAKQRLAAALPREVRRTLARAMVADVLAALSEVRGIDALVVVTAEPEAAALAREHATVLHDDAQTGQSEAAAIGVRHALEAGFDRVIMLPGDTPLVEPAEVDRLLDRAAADALAVAIVADRHGTGTNALVLSPPDAIAPSFGPDSRARHVAAAEAAGVEHRVERAATIEHDVDTRADLAALVDAVAAGRAGGERTRRELDLHAGALAGDDAQAGLAEWRSS